MAATVLSIVSFKVSLFYVDMSVCDYSVQSEFAPDDKRLRGVVAWTKVESRRSRLVEAMSVWRKLIRETVDPTVLCETFCKNADEYQWNIYMQVDATNVHERAEK